MNGTTVDYLAMSETPNQSICRLLHEWAGANDAVITSFYVEHARATACFVRDSNHVVQLTVISTHPDVIDRLIINDMIQWPRIKITPLLYLSSDINVFIRQKDLLLCPRNHDYSRLSRLPGRSPTECEHCAKDRKLLADIRCAGSTLLTVRSELALPAELTSYVAWFLVFLCPPLIIMCDS